jgi:hypothetical protein
VTIAAGFKCSDGFVLCADTQESGQAFKRRVPKLEMRPKAPAETDICRMVVTGAGSSSFVDSLIEEMWSAANGAKESRLDEVSGRVKNALIEHYRKIWSIYPKQTNPQLLPSASLIFAIWTRNGSELFLARDHDINPISTYGAVGCGDELAQYICEPLFVSQLNTRQVTLLAIYMLEQVKKNVLDCGGDSHIAVLGNNGAVAPIPPIGAFMLENQLAAFDRSFSHLMLAAVDDGVGDRQFLQVFTIFRDEIIRLRQQYRINHAEFWSEVENANKRLAEIGRKAMLKLKPKQPSVSRKSKRAR